MIFVRIFAHGMAKKIVLAWITMEVGRPNTGAQYRFV